MTPEQILALAQRDAADAANLQTFRELRARNPFTAARHYQDNTASILRAIDAECSKPTPPEAA